MRLVRTANSNFTYTGPTPEIADMPCRRGDGTVRSVWEFTDEERADIAAGANVELAIWQEPIPPVSLKVVLEPEQPHVDDLRCVDCSNLYVKSRGLDHCGYCGGDLLDAPLECVVVLAVSREQAELWIEQQRSTVGRPKRFIHAMDDRCLSDLRPPFEVVQLPRADLHPDYTTAKQLLDRAAARAGVRLQVQPVDIA